LLNVVVVGIGTWMSIKKNVFDWKLFWPFLIFSVPMAFFGAQFGLSTITFFLILGVSLIVSALFLVWQSMNHEPKSIQLTTWKRGVIGGGIGLLSGLVGIGGGIFLSPILNVTGWSNPRKIAALASVFILVNSISGILGLLLANTFAFDLHTVLPLVLAVMLGGLIGSYLSSEKMNVSAIRVLTALLVAYVGVRLVLLHGFQISI
jgi:uncharacterized membrane protein YfcA